MCNARVAILSILVCVQQPLLNGQTNATNAPDINQAVKSIMNTSVNRCYTTTKEGISRISWVPASNEDVNKIKDLGKAAIPILDGYITAQSKDGFTQLFAVKFLIQIGGRPTETALEHALSSDQWDVTKAQALSGLYQVSTVDALPYIYAALSDPSQLVRQRARELSELYSR